jgi:hypothetical protein
MHLPVRGSEEGDYLNGGVETKVSAGKQYGSVQVLHSPCRLFRAFGMISDGNPADRLSLRSALIRKLTLELQMQL